MSDINITRSFLPRYLRIVSANYRSAGMLSIRDELLKREHRIYNSDEEDHLSVSNDGPLMEVSWMGNFLALPASYGLTSLQDIYKASYKELGLFPMDIASALAVSSLGINSRGCRPLKVLDLCCCPGAKLMYIWEMLPEYSAVVGVDISQQRLQTCQALLQKWHLSSTTYNPALANTRQLLFHCDGQLFGPRFLGDLVYDSFIMQQELAFNGNRKRKNRSARARISKCLHAAKEQLNSSSEIEDTTEHEMLMDKFDYVLVDAECTHDASYRHMKYFEGDSSNGLTKNKWSRKDDTQVSGEMHLSQGINARDLKLSLDGKSQLRDLQRALILNGYSLLAPGGVLVYSTCSEDTEQNEDIISWLLNQKPCAYIEASPLYSFAPEGSDGASIFADIQKYSLGDSERATQMCKVICNLMKPILMEGSLPGTIRVGDFSGTSGHFIARIRKSSVGIAQHSDNTIEKDENKPSY